MGLFLISVCMPLNLFVYFSDFFLCRINLYRLKWSHFTSNLSIFFKDQFEHLAYSIGLSIVCMCHPNISWVSPNNFQLVYKQNIFRTCNYKSGNCIGLKEMLLVSKRPKRKTYAYFTNKKKSEMNKMDIQMKYAI